MKDFLQKHTFYNMMKQNIYFKGDGGLCTDLQFTYLTFSFVKTNSLETGLSDQLMIYTILKTKFENFETEKLTYLNFKQLDKDQFKLDISNRMFVARIHSAFKNTSIALLDKHAPKKTKILRGNQKPHFNTDPRKQIMIRSRLGNKANKSRSPIDFAKFKWQQNLVTYLNKQDKLLYFEKLSVDCNSKPFGKHVDCTSQIKIAIYKKILMLLEKDQCLSKQKDVA